MSRQTVSQAVEKRNSGPGELVRQSRSWFATIVPSHIDAAAFVALTVAHLRRNPKLADAAARNPQSFMAALSDCARLGLTVGDTYHLVPFEDRRNGTVEITGIVDYTGEIELIYRAGAVASVKAEIVYSGDDFHFTTDMDRPHHAPKWFGDRGQLIGAYAYAVMKDGATSKVVVYSKAEIDRVMAVSKTKDRADSPWKLWYDRMALKTVIHRLEHFVPTSAEYRREQIRAAAEVAQQVNAGSVAGTAAAEDIPDAEIVEEASPVPPAGEKAAATPPDAGMAAPAGGGSPAPATPEPQAGAGPSKGQVGVIRQHFKRLGYDDADPAQKEERLVFTARLAGRDAVISSTGDLNREQAQAVAEALERCRDRAALVALITDGEVPQ